MFDAFYIQWLESVLNFQHQLIKCWLPNAESSTFFKE